MNNEMKLKYEEPKMELVLFDSSDIITTSNGWEGEIDPLV